MSLGVLSRTPASNSSTKMAGAPALAFGSQQMKARENEDRAPKTLRSRTRGAGIEFTNNGDQPGVRVTKAAAARPAEPCSAQSRRVAAKVVGRKTAKAEREETINVARSVSSDKSRLHPTNVKSAVWRVTRKPNRSTPTEPSFRSEAAIPVGCSTRPARPLPAPCPRATMDTTAAPAVAGVPRWPRMPSSFQ
jgi:hypothetical protein